ncbi:MAG TPA: sulfocyanin-like copper-binding protein [Candidatus Dormibacteraeota bacterium]|nr:sulfocyanin-like copper-binding protein [Candidatus Dormibacteraeota bacterium]
MIRPSWRLLGVGLALGLGGLVAGCGGGPLSSADAGVGCSVTVEIPVVQSALLGTVTASYHGSTHLLTRNTSTILLGCGQKAVLSASPTSPGSHPFTGWRVEGNRTGDTTVTVVADGLITASPTFYVAVRPSPTPSPSLKATGTPTPSTKVLDQWLSYDLATKVATLKLEAGYGNVNNTLSFDGEAKGALDVTVPQGWTVVVNFSNVDKINHSAAIVTTTGTTPVFPGASIANPTVGIPAGDQATFSFVAGQAGSYRIACLVPGHEDAGMWATFDVTASGLPTIHL